MRIADLGQKRFLELAINIIINERINLNEKADVRKRGVCKRLV